MNTKRIERIKFLLEKEFTPKFLEVIDDSEAHRGHAGAAGGGGHFTVIIASETLVAVSRVEAHRRIYAALADMMPDDIHALAIKLRG